MSSLTVPRIVHTCVSQVYAVYSLVPRLRGSEANADGCKQHKSYHCWHHCWHRSLTSEIIFWRNVVNSLSLIDCWTNPINSSYPAIHECCIVYTEPVSPYQERNRDDSRSHEHLQNLKVGNWSSRSEIHDQLVHILWFALYKHLINIGADN